MEWWWNPPTPYGIYRGVLSTAEKAIWLKLMNREQEGKVKLGLTGWVNSGIKIQEAQ